MDFRLADIGTEVSRRMCLVLFAAMVFAVSGGMAHAMSYVPMTDEALLSKADLVVSGQIAEATGMPGRELDETIYRFVVDEVLKGTTDSSELTIRLPGAFDQAASGALIVPGMPRFSVGETPLLFLNKRADNSYAPSQLMLGVFREREDVTGGAVLTQDLRQAEAIGSPGNSQGNGRYRNAQRFEKWIRDRAQGRPNNERYWSDNDLKPGGKYRLSDPLVRWFNFQQGENVLVYANESEATAADTESLQAAISMWNAEPNSAVQLSYAGLSPKSSGLRSADGVNLIVFNDPSDELLGTFDCLLGGIGAYGVWRSYGMRAFGDAMYGEIYEGDVVVQDGLSCLFNGNPTSMDELLAHELGHVLGIDHSCGEGLLAICTPGTVEDDALMRPTLHADGRGAALGSDDVAALRKLYSTELDDTADPTASADDEAASGGGALGLQYVLTLLAFAAGGWIRRTKLTGKPHD